MKVKLIGVLAVVAAFFIGVVMWRTDSFVYGDRMNWVESQTRTQVGAINHSLATELKSLQRVVATFTADNFQKGKLNWASLAPYYAAASFVVSGETLDPQVVVLKENSKAANWNKDFIQAAIGNLAGKTADMRFYVKPFQDSQHGRYVALVFLEGNKAYALIGSGEVFQSLIDAQKGALSSFSIVTSAGLTVGHSIPEYLGTVMRDDPVFKEAQQSGSSHGSNTFKLNTGDLYGMYEVVPQSNLLVLSSAPLADTMKGRSGLWWQFLLLGAGLVLVGVGAILWVILPAEKKMENLQQQILEEQSKPAPISETQKVVLPDPEQMHKEKMEASMRVASALAHEMRGPLAAILGYSQMILAKSPESDIVQSTDSILRETRAARGVLDKLLGYAGEEVKEKNSMKVEGPLVKALKEMEPLFEQKGVKLTKNIQETSAMDLHVEAIIRALKNILNNSVEAMERMAKKEITVSLSEDTEGIHLSIQDTGEGIEPQNAERIFDPFFTTRSFQNHMGLGLSVAFGILKEHNAEIKVESQRGQGTKILILFKKLKTEAVLKAPLAAPQEKEEEVTIAMDLPQLKEDAPERIAAEVAAAAESAAPTSPLDVNIDAMLELPEATPDKAPEKGAEESSAQVVAPVGAPTPPPISTPVPKPAKTASAPVAKSSFGDDELTFIDGFLDDQPGAPVEAASVAEETEAPAAGPTPEEIEAMSAEVTSVNFIVPPKMNAKIKTSKLDSYHVEIRRPGKRI